MKENRKYEVAGHRFTVAGDNLCVAVAKAGGFRPFETAEGEPHFAFVEDTGAPAMESVQYTFRYEDVAGVFGRMRGGYKLELKPSGEEALHLWTADGENDVRISGNLSARLCRFALWVGYGVMTLPYDTVAVHGSCIVCHGRAVLFLGESGTGKSTHTRLWREHIDGAVLLNDDSPVIRVEDGRVWAYGSPWSGKTPCYRREHRELTGCVRLTQAPYNRIERLSALRAYGAVHPSCPPEFAYDDTLYGHICGFIGRLLTAVPVYHLACLPDREAALLSYATIFRDCHEKNSQ